VNPLWIKRDLGLLFLPYWSIVRRLAIRPGAIGDFIVSLPALECLAGRKPGDWLEIWTASAHVPLVRFAQRVRGIAGTGLDLLGVADPPARLLAELAGFDSIVSWYGANRPEFRALVDSLGLPFSFFAALPPEARGVHAVDFYLEQVRSLTDRPSDGVPRIACRPEDAGIREPADFAVIHPFYGSPAKNWPLERFRSLARGLERRLAVRWCAGPEDPPLPGAVRIDDLYRLACWISGARLYAGNDSGITHLAAATGIPVLALFGPTDPAVWAPRGEHVRVATWEPVGRTPPSAIGPPAGFPPGAGT
jgi:ADP-heptose:LPS heptosyltransferase